MHTVPNPVRSRGAFAGVIKYLLKPNQSGAVFGGQSCHDILPGAHTCTPFFIVGQAFSDREGKGLAEHEPEIRIGGERRREECVVVRFVLIDRHAAALVIDPDENTQNIRLEVEHIRGPAFPEIKHGIAGDTTIDEIEVERGKRRSVFCRDDEGVSVAQNMIRIRAAAPVAVRDRITLEENPRARSKYCDRFAGPTAAEEAKANEAEKRASTKGPNQIHTLSDWTIEPRRTIRKTEGGRRVGIGTLRPTAIRLRNWIERPVRSELKIGPGRAIEMSLRMQPRVWEPNFQTPWKGDGIG